MGTVVPKNEKENAKHSATIQRIASSNGLSPDQVRPIYEKVLASMNEEAKIKDFVSIFVTRKVEKMVQEKAA